MNQKMQAFIVAVAAMLSAYPASSQTVDPPGSIVDGKSIGDWGAGWWTWMSQFPAVGNPLDDPTGALATVNNNGPVFYVAGFGTAPRSFSVPEGTPLLFPMSNLAAVQYPVSLENQIVSAFYAGTVSLTATIDGTPITNLASHAETSGVFSMGHAIPGSFGETFETPGFPGDDPADCGTFTPDLLCPAISMGYWLMVNLPAGEHTITTGGSITFDLPDDPTYFPGGGTVSFSSLTTDIIDVVVPEPASALLLVPGIIAISLYQARRRNSWRRRA